jgi:predicted enzyme related to lactoylglutathione lyase
VNVFRPGDVTYLRIPAEDQELLAGFYAAVFGWRTRDGRAFEDASGSVIGHFSTEHAVAGEAGFRPYVYVDSVTETLARVDANGGAVVVEPYPEGNLEVAVVEDPAGNVLGVWTSS